MNKIKKLLEKKFSESFNKDNYLILESSGFSRNCKPNQDLEGIEKSIYIFHFPIIIGINKKQVELKINSLDELNTLIKNKGLQLDHHSHILGLLDITDSSIIFDAISEKEKINSIEELKKAIENKTVLSIDEDGFDSILINNDFDENNQTECDENDVLKTTKEEIEEFLNEMKENTITTFSSKLEFEFISIGTFEDCKEKIKEFLKSKSNIE